jgi:hypothetical protein
MQSALPMKLPRYFSFFLPIILSFSFPLATQAFSSAQLVAANAQQHTAPAWHAPMSLPTQATATRRYATAPADFPVITVTVPASNTAERHIFLATFAGAKPPYLLILDPKGEPVYYERLPAGKVVTDFKRQSNGNLTYFIGDSALGGGAGEFRELDASYQLTHMWQAQNGVDADNHDLQILPNGNALMVAYERKPRDLSAIGGLTNTLFADCLVQEISPSGALVWEWRQSDHIPITDTYEIITGTTADPYHMNAVELDLDGNVLVSSRHLSEITKINRATGEVMWRLGGKGNVFTFTNDSGFSYQHDIRRLSNGHITLWDNGVQKSPQYSRAVEYEIDETTKTITRVWEYRETPDVFSFFMGNVQRLANGNSFLGWGGPKNLINEVGADGSKRFELTVDSSAGFIYRAFRFPWQATPVTTPTLVLTDAIAGTSALHFSWNGATDITDYRIEGWNRSKTLTFTNTISRTGFENSVLVSNLPEFTCYYRVMPLKNGSDTRYSDVIYRGGDICDAQLSFTLYLPFTAAGNQ